MEIERDGFRIFYDKNGDGPENLLLFHGFGQDRSVFNPLINQVGSRYTCYSFDLFFHGEDSIAQPSAPILPEEWDALLSAFLDQENIQRFSLAGFSIGARLVISAITRFAPRLNTVYLIAPEGISINIWYRLATSTTPGRYLFSKFVRRPKYFFKAATTAENVGLLPRKVAQFAKKLMESAPKRNRVYATWLAMSKLKTDRDTLLTALNMHSVRVVVFLGKRDRIIPIKPVLNFIRRLEKKAEVYMIDSAHITMVRTVSHSFAHVFKDGNDNPH